MNDYELPLVLFTVLSQTTVGVAWVTAFKTGVSTGRGPAIISAAFLGFALAASLFHLGHPALAVTALRNLGSA